jgi:hypothetical protein
VKHRSLAFTPGQSDVAGDIGHLGSVDDQELHLATTLGNNDLLDDTALECGLSTRSHQELASAAPHDDRITTAEHVLDAAHHLGTTKDSHQANHDDDGQE